MDTYTIKHNQITVNTMKSCTLDLNEFGAGIIVIPINIVDRFGATFRELSIIKIQNLLYGEIEMVTVTDKSVVIKFYTKMYITTEEG